MRVLITGAAGHLGPPVCRAFIEDGATVRALCHRTRLKIPGYRLEIAWGDVTKPDSVINAVQGVDAVVHMAGLLQPLTENNPHLAARVNIGGTRSVVDAVKSTGRRIPLVYTSSTAVYGPCPDMDGVIDPDIQPLNPSTVYAQTKIEAENIIRESGIDYVILRLTSIPYPRIRLSDAKNHLLTIPLRNRIEFCHPDDMAAAVLNSVKRIHAVKGQTLLIAGGPDHQMHFEDMLKVVLGVFGLPLPPRGKFATESFPLHWYDTTRSRKLLQFQSRTLDDYAKDLAANFPAPLVSVMRRVIGPALGRLIVRLL
ncbi:MAG: NAD(P)-dependent oxidoreductase [Dehalococcoidia bacterium]|nr:NAD(P)-dependent oxidoreductase [Dehalococcoidia bacterium]